MRFPFKQILIPILICISLQNFGQSGMKKMFVDTADNAFDVGNWMMNYNGFFPLISIITEPAVENGLGMGLLFLKQDEEALKEGKHVAPTIYGLGGLYTFNQSWGVAGFYSGV